MPEIVAAGFQLARKGLGGRAVFYLIERLVISSEME
jgi:hypothetical protein